MNSRKGILGLSIALGVCVGGYLGSVASEFLLGGAMVGGLLGGLVYYLVNLVVSRRKSVVLPFDRFDEHHQANNSVNTQSPESRYRGMQDALMEDFMRFTTKH